MKFLWGFISSFLWVIWAGERWRVECICRLSWWGGIPSQCLDSDPWDADPEATQQPFTFTTFSRLTYFLTWDFCAAYFNPLIVSHIPTSFSFNSNHSPNLHELSEDPLSIWSVDSFPNENLQCHWLAVGFVLSVYQHIIVLNKATTLSFTAMFDFTNFFLIKWRSWFFQIHIKVLILWKDSRFQIGFLTCMEY